MDMEEERFVSILAGEPEPLSLQAPSRALSARNIPKGPATSYAPGAEGSVHAMRCTLPSVLLKEKAAPVPFS